MGRTSRHDSAPLMMRRRSQTSHSAMADGVVSSIMRMTFARRDGSAGRPGLSMPAWRSVRRIRSRSDIDSRQWPSCFMASSL